ncbi:hypothetical protein HBF26_14355 [Luteibacter jiangsuensis]|uniref:Uncharacterized protein n=1 Tax=Luteibacter jiangsuensis TaxID=637577 RepID=A0ABX0Q8V8_9GAMM|nr:hypothetical protein [Luteibacter jiangsuensis]NID06077.1 hypothetical protein [Luteibacter jiangsuensis]
MWRIEIKEAGKERINPQNAALFGVAYPKLTEATSYTEEELRHEFCGGFFGWEVVDILGATRSRPRRMTTTNEQGERAVLYTSDFAALCEMMQQIGAEVGIDVPSPDPFHGEQRWTA